MSYTINRWLDSTENLINELKDTEKLIKYNTKRKKRMEKMIIISVSSETSSSSLLLMQFKLFGVVPKMFLIWLKL